jgi:hypothetical protein
LSRTFHTSLLVAATTVVAFLPVRAWPQINMPDPSMIAGRALPAPELPDGTVSVRTVREAIGNNIVGQQVTVTAGSESKSGTTDELGRAMVTGLPAGAQATAITEVDGESLVSHPFEVPGRGGIRIILISGIEEAAERRAQAQAAEAAAPATKGTVVFGGDSRIVMEFRDDELRVFYILEIVNTARARVDIGGPLVLELPEGAEQVTILDGSTRNASATDERVTVVGPFAAGSTSLQIAFGIGSGNGTLTMAQRWPVRLEQVMVMLQKVPNLEVSSPQMEEQDEARAQNGTPYIIGGGPGVAAGTTTSMTLTGLPVHPAWPRNTAMALAALIILVGAWFTRSAQGSTTVDHHKLRNRRESLMGELVKLDEQRRAGRVDGSKYAARRQKLVSDLERVYGELDGATPSRSGGGEAVA